jgi:hypothetical protein
VHKGHSLITVAVYIEAKRGKGKGRDGEQASHSIFLPSLFENINAIPALSGSQAIVCETLTFTPQGHQRNNIKKAVKQ